MAFDGCVFGAVIGIGFVVSQYYQNPSILYIAVIFSIGMNFISYWFSDKIVLLCTKPNQLN